LAVLGIGYNQPEYTYPHLTVYCIFRMARMIAENIYFDHQNNKFGSFSVIFSVTSQFTNP
jgi:hypothetical protein